MLIQQTSIDSFHIVKQTRNTVQQKLLNTLLSQGEASNRQLHIITKIPINSVTARISELRESGAVKQAGMEYDSTTNRTVMTWEIV